MDSRELKETEKYGEAADCSKPAANKIAAAIVISKYYNITFAEALTTTCKISN